MVLLIVIAVLFTISMVRWWQEQQRYERMLERDHAEFCADVRAMVDRVGDEVDATVFADRRAA